MRANKENLGLLICRGKPDVSRSQSMMMEALEEMGRSQREGERGGGVLVWLWLIWRWGSEKWTVGAG